MKRLLFALCTLFFIEQSVTAQVTEWGIMSGFSNYKGDLVVEGLLMKEVRPSLGLFYRTYDDETIFRSRFFLSYSQLSGHDNNYVEKNNPSFDFRVKRNLSFLTHYVEAGAILEMNFIERDYYVGMNEYFFRAYFLGGASLAYFRPTAEFQGKVYNLHKIQTEEKSYTPACLSIPLGLGFETELTDNITIGLEGMYRFTSTDYLDDVSGNYADIKAVKNRAGLPGVYLAYRNLESQYPTWSDTFAKQNNKAGKARGNAKDRDGILSIYLTLAFSISR